MAPVAGRPFLDYLFRLLVRRGLSRIVLLTGYLGEQVESHFGSGTKWGVKITYVQEQTPLGTGGAVRDAEPVLDDTFLVLNGDTYLDCDYRELYARLRETEADAVMAVYGNADNLASNNVHVDASGQVAAYSKTQIVGMTQVDAGAYAMRRSTLRLLPSLGPASLEYDLFPGIADRGTLVAYPVPQRFFDIGTLQRVADVERFLA